MAKKLILNENKNITLVYRKENENAVLLAKKLAEWLNDKKFKVFTAPDQKVIPGTSLIKSDTAWNKMSLIIVLGGDGTYLRAVRFLAGRQIPILGIHMGSLGFLTGFRSDDAFAVLEDTLNGKMSYQKRSMLEAQVFKSSKKIKDYLALNDVVLERGSFAQLIYASIQSEDLLVGEVRADGFIISSPTGSTAYNLAAGGPILHPEAKSIVLTPIAPHSLTLRPLIFPDDKELRLKVLNKNQKGRLVIDGQTQMDIDGSCEVVIKKSSFVHWIVRSASHNDFQVLREKLKFGERN